MEAIKTRHHWDLLFLIIPSYSLNFRTGKSVDIHIWSLRSWSILPDILGLILISLPEAYPDLLSREIPCSELCHVTQLTQLEHFQERDPVVNPTTWGRILIPSLKATCTMNLTPINPWQYYHTFSLTRVFLSLNYLPITRSKKTAILTIQGGPTRLDTTSPVSKKCVW
jgi:hypothetical protein